MAQHDMCTYYGGGLNQLKELNEFEGDNDDNKSIMSTSYTNTYVCLPVCVCMCVNDNRTCMQHTKFNRL